MMMRMLEVGGMPILTDNIRAANEDNPNGYYEFEPVKQLSRANSWVGDASGKAVKVIYRLLSLLPKDYQYRVIFMERSIEEILASQRLMLERRGEAHNSSDDEHLTTLFQRELQQVKAWLRDQKNFDVIYVDYGDVQNDPEKTARLVAGFLGYRLDIQAMSKVVDSGLYHQRR
jgi:hypothetical protein